MGDEFSDGADVERLLTSAREGDGSAYNQLITHVCHRMRRLTRKMLRGFARLRRWEETDDVLQNALIRLHRALNDVKPVSARDFFALASTQIRRELIDLSRRHFGPLGPASHHDTNGRQEVGDTPRPMREGEDISHEPGRLALWGEFHEQVAALPTEDREVFDLLWYQALTQAQAATLLKVTERTVRRRWQAARLRLHDALHGELPI